MFGKAVKIRHCPATVSGKFRPEAITAQVGRSLVKNRPAASQETGSSLGNQITFSREKRTMRTILLLSLSLGLSAGENLQLHGTILDPSGRPVEAARVTCQNQAVYSNAEGRFAISGVSQCQVNVEKPGFDSRTADLTAASDAKITLDIAGRVDTVVVSANRTETTPEQAAVAANVITEQDLAARQFPMIFDVLREIPGLQIDEYGPPGTLAEVFTRGADSTGTLVLLDGVPLNDPGGSIHLENLTSEGLDRVEIVRGPESALFGAEAAAGVIQLFTKHGNAESDVPHGSVSYERGSFQTDRWIANLTGGLLSRFDYALSASEFHTVGEWPNTFNRNNTGTANIGYKISGRHAIARHLPGLRRHRRHTRPDRLWHRRSGAQRT